MTIDEQLAYLVKGAAEVITPDELRDRLEKSQGSGKPLTIKVGFDPTAPDLHLGHTVILRKMKHFQDLGHRVVFLIGDFTGLIGDPSGRNKSRPPMTREQIEANAETYRSQVFKILDPEKTVIDFNSRWLAKLSSIEWVRLCGHYTVARMLERDDFAKRLAAFQPISIHELLYPLAQAYDSVALQVDVEMGGTDQKFNLLVGRDIQREFGQIPQLLVMMPILEGLDGVEKMSKSLGNYIGVTDSPEDMFGKLMSISDELMWRYYELLTDMSRSELESHRSKVASGSLHPMEAKSGLAQRVVADFHSAEAAGRAAEHFRKVFQQREDPDEMPEICIPSRADETIPLVEIIVSSGFAASKSAARRLLQQGGVSIDGQKVGDPAHSVAVGTAGEFVLKVGKRKFARVRIG